MTPKERMLRILSGESVDVMPVELMVGTEFLCRHSGVSTLEFFYDADARATKKAQAHIDFLERFRPDAVVLWSRGAPKHWRERYAYVQTGGRVLMVDRRTGKRWPMSDDHYAVFMDELPDPGPYHFERGEVEVIVNGKQYFAITDKFDIRSRSDVDRLLPLEPAESVIERGMFEVVRTMAKSCGDTEFIEPSGPQSLFRFAMGILGFPDGLVFMREKPDVFKHLMERILQQNIQYAKAFKVLGADGVHTGDLWAGNDLISPDDWMEFAFPYTLELCRHMRQLGLKVKYYFVGDPHRRLESLARLPVDSLQVEESFGIDLGEVRRAVGPDVCLHTNLDAIHLLDHGTPAEVQAALAAQVQAAGGPQRLICSLGSEITLNTPPENIAALIEAAHRYSP
jgi:uroporphyrinogen-III decarboxylase